MGTCAWADACEGGRGGLGAQEAAGQAQGESFECAAVFPREGQSGIGAAGVALHETRCWQLLIGLRAA